MEIKGKYGTAIVYATVVDETTKEQIKNLMDQKFTKDLNVRIMADCHAGTGCVIGTTMNINDCVVPNLVGVDIGCGMLTVKLGKCGVKHYNFHCLRHTFATRAIELGMIYIQN